MLIQGRSKSALAHEDNALHRLISGVQIWSLLASQLGLQAWCSAPFFPHSS